MGRERPELDLHVSVHREDAHAERRYDFRPPEKIKPPRTITDPVLVAMAGKLRTPEGKATYRKRACTVEPVFGIIKAVLGFRQFAGRRRARPSGKGSALWLSRSARLCCGAWRKCAANGSWCAWPATSNACTPWAGWPRWAENPTREQNAPQAPPPNPEPATHQPRQAPTAEAVHRIAASK